MDLIPRLLALVLAALANLAADEGSRVPTGSRAEYFVLELVETPGPVLEAPPGDAREVGLALLRRHEVGPRLVLEWELRFRTDDDFDTRVRHVEVFEDGLRRFVWREYRPGSGRTLFVEELDRAGRMRSVEWGGPDGLREEWLAPGGALFPLDLIERARSASVRAGELLLFEPLEGRFEPMELATRVEFGAPLGVAPRNASFARGALAIGGAPLARTVEVRRADGSLAGAYRFVGSRLEAFQWQAGSARARRVPQEVWLRRAERIAEADRADRD